MTFIIVVDSAASITIPGSGNDQVGNGMGMVKFGTKCGDGKVETNGPSSSLINYTYYIIFALFSYLYVYVRN